MIEPSVARGWLDAERERLEGSLRGLRAEGLDVEPEAESIGELAATSQHPADVGSETFERERDLTFLDELRAQRAEVDHALAKLAEGRYGVCEQCHQPIDRARLKALPTARYCKADEDRYEVGGPYVYDVTVSATDTTEVENGFLPADDELEPTEESTGPEADAVTARDEAELMEGAFEELETEGVFEDELMEGLLPTELTEDEIEAGLEELTTESEEEEAEEEEAEREEVSFEELLAEELEEGAEEGVVETEESELDLSGLVRRQFGLEAGPSGGRAVRRAPSEAEEEGLPEPRRADEFLCSSCFQLKRRTLLADPARSRCVDCVNSDRGVAPT